MLNISETVRIYRHSFNGIVIRTYTIHNTHALINSVVSNDLN